MKPLAIIPARASSKRLPGKNRMPIGGRSLVQIARMQAAAAFGEERVVLSTDDYGHMAGVGYFISRPLDLALDNTPMMDVVRSVVEVVRGPIGATFGCRDFDAVVLLQPTSPLRTVDDIRNAVALLDDSGADAVISVVETSAPEIFTIGHAGRLRPAALHRDGLRLAQPNGAIFAITTAALDRGLDWWTADVVRAYEMPPERSVDIDTIVDLERARELWVLQQH